MLAQLFYGALAAGSVAASAIEVRQTNTGTCPTLHVIACGGANYTDPAAYGRLGSLAALIVKQVPGSNSVSSPYNKVQIGAKAHQLQPGAIDQGITTLETYVSEFTASCPKSKIAMIGYSSGAVITMGSICAGTVSQSLAGSTIVAVTAYGDQTRVSGQPYDIGTGGQSCNGLDASLRNPATCGNFIPIIKSWCDTNDPECCGGPPEDYQIHLSYSGKYDTVAAAYVVNQYNDAVGGSSSSASSGSASATASTSAGGFGVIGGGSASTTATGSASSASSASTTVNTSASNASASSASSALAGLGSAASSASSAASASATSAAATVSSAASSVASSVSSAAASATSAAAAATTSLTPANPNGASLIAPSFALGALGLIMVALY